MASMDIHLDGDGVWSDLLEKKPEDVIHTTEHMAIAALSAGMTSGRPSIAIRINLPDGKVVVAETSMRLFLNAADAFRARYRKDIV
jgi:hypothetical protein